MADFTINSLSTGTPIDTDNFLKSDASGGLTKVPFGTIKESVKAECITPSNVANNCTTTESGYALDARQGKILNDHISTIQQGSIERLNLTSIYGFGWQSNINIDMINNMYGYVYRIRDDIDTFGGTSPSSIIGGNAFLLIGFSELRDSITLSYGVQIAIGIGSSKIAIRNAPFAQAGATWSAWKEV